MNFSCAVLMFWRQFSTAGEIRRCPVKATDCGCLCAAYLLENPALNGLARGLLLLPGNACRLCALLPFVTLAAIEEIEFHASVGTMEFLPIDANEVRLILEIEGKDDCWFDRKRDVSDVELESDVSGKRLVLRQTEEGTNTEWTVQMPAVARTTIEMGVGEIDGELRATEFEIELGKSLPSLNASPRRTRGSRARRLPG